MSAVLSFCCGACRTIDGRKDGPCVFRSITAGPSLLAEITQRKRQKTMSNKTGEGEPTNAGQHRNRNSR